MTYLLYVTCEVKRIIFYATTTPFQKEKYVRLSALNELSIAGGWPEQSTFHLGPIGMAMKGAPSTLVVCVEGGGALVAAKLGTLSISASVFTVWGTSVSAEGVTLFSEGLGTGHHGVGTIATLLGCGSLGPVVNILAIFSNAN